MPLVNPAFINGRSFVRNFYDLLDKGSDDELLNYKLKLKKLHAILDDSDVLAKCDEYIKLIDEELLLRQDILFTTTIVNLNKE